MDNAEIQQLNRDFRKKDKPTDILSFPFYPDLAAGDRIILDDDDESELGDIAISVERVITDAKDLNVTFEARLKRLLAHGIAHLLGHDHETDDEYALMKPVEDNLLASCL
jgi:probable rRNA maturation factor